MTFQNLRAWWVTRSHSISRVGVETEASCSRLQSVSSSVTAAQMLIQFIIRGRNHHWLPKRPNSDTCSLCLFTSKMSMLDARASRRLVGRLCQVVKKASWRASTVCHWGQGNWLLLPFISKCFQLDLDQGNTQDVPKSNAILLEEDLYQAGLRTAVLKSQSSATRALSHERRRNISASLAAVWRLCTTWSAMVLLRENGSKIMMVIPPPPPPKLCGGENVTGYLVLQGCFNVTGNARNVEFHQDDFDEIVSYRLIKEAFNHL